MPKEQKSFSGTKFYPIFFMVVITIIFIGILATFYHLTAEKIQTYNKDNLKKLILNSFDLPVEDINLSYSNYISEKEINDLLYFQANKDGLCIGNCFLISGSGLWGTINALVSLTPDFQEIINFEIISQNETPGLGGRITEDWFKKQFQKKSIMEEKSIVFFYLIPEGESQNKDQINQITGATFSSKAVVDMLHKELKKINEVLNNE